MFDVFVQSLLNCFSPEAILFLNIGLLVGIVFGAIPGLTALLGVILFLPFTFGMSSTTGILMLLGIYCGGTYGGSVSAILINTPGTANAAATVMDGYAMAKKGEARKALLAALYASVFGGVISGIVLLFSAPQISKLTRFFGPAEYFSLAVFGISIIASISGKNLLKGLMTGCLGIIVSMIGQDQQSGVFRFSFGILDLAAGINIVPALVGLFAISEIFMKIKNRNEAQSKTDSVKMSKDTLTMKEFFKHWVTLIRSTIIGIIIGALPGTGGGIAAFISYTEAKKNSKHPENFGKGELDGVLAPESGNNAVTGGALIPTITLGVPGDAVTAVLLGALMINGLIPGERIFIDYRDTMYTLLVGFIIINIFMLVQGRILIKFFFLITKVPDKMLMPILLVVCSAGCFAVSNTIFNVFVMLCFGVLAYILINLNFPLVPLLLGLILGPTAESNLQRAMTISDGSITIFFTHPISLIFLLLSIFGVGMTLYSRRSRQIQQ
jgi:putative tricarboxylic transport membrane protein